jgi:hypothetical protein
MTVTLSETGWVFDLKQNKEKLADGLLIDECASLQFFHILSTLKESIKSNIIKECIKHC